MRWTWDRRKDAINRAKQGLSLRLGEVALSDRLAVSAHDPHPDGDRWNTVCEVDGVILYVVHTRPDEANVTGRIISVRRGDTS
jgi:uncharacterized DUF497 family protein